MMPEHRTTRVRTHHLDAERGSVDERWIRVWSKWGVQDFEALLASHAAFDRYCVEHGYGA